MKCGRRANVWKSDPDMVDMNAKATNYAAVEGKELSADVKQLHSMIVSLVQGKHIFCWMKHMDTLQRCSSEMQLAFILRT